MGHSARSAVHVAFWMLCVTGGFAILSSTISKNPVLSPLQASLKTPTEGSGFIFSASTIPGILISLPAASLSDVFGRRRFLLFAGFVFATAPFLYLLITVWWQLILVRFYHGFATAIFVPVAEASIAELFPSKRGERISVFTAATYVGRLIAPLLGAYLLVATNSGLPYTDFHLPYVVAAVAGVTALVVALPFFARKGSTTEPQERTAKSFRHMFSGWRKIVHNRGVLVVSLIQASQYFAYGAVESYLTSYLTLFLHYTLLIPGMVNTCIIGVAVFARPYMGRVSDKIGRRLPIVMGCVIAAAPLFVIPFVTDLAVLIVLAILYGFGFATVTASTSPLISELVPMELVGASMGFLATTMDAGQTIGPIVSGFMLATSLQYFGVFPALAIVVLFSSVVFYLSGISKTSSSDAKLT